MNVWLDAILILIVILGLFIVASTRLGTMIQIFAMQSAILGCVPFFLYAKEMEVYIIIVSLAAIVLRGFIMPNFLFWAIRHVSVRSEVSPFIGLGTTLLLSAFSIVGSFLLASKLVFPVPISSQIVIPSSFSLIIMGFILIVGRTKAISQVVGYLLLENGIFLFAILLLKKMPLLVEMGILLDLFIAAVVMGIVVNNISDEFNNTDTTVLTTLKD
jgi:hydrogenase-4 component E